MDADESARQQQIWDAVTRSHIRNPKGDYIHPFGSEQTLEQQRNKRPPQSQARQRPEQPTRAPQAISFTQQASVTRVIPVVQQRQEYSVPRKHRGVVGITAFVIALILIINVILMTFSHQSLAGVILQQFQLQASQPASSRQSLHASQYVRTLDSANQAFYSGDPNWVALSYISCSGFSFYNEIHAWDRVTQGKFPNAGQAESPGKILAVEIKLGSLSPDGIYIGETYYERIANHFGFSYSWREGNPSKSNPYGITIDNIINMANKGYPVIVGLADTIDNVSQGMPDFSSGHILVVKGGDSQFLYVGDSSPAQLTRIGRNTFQHLWDYAGTRGNLKGHWAFFMFPKGVPSPV